MLDSQDHQVQQGFQLPRAESPEAVTNPQMLRYAEASRLLRVDKRTLNRRIVAGRYLVYGEGRGRRLLYQSIIDDINRSINQNGGATSQCD